MTARGTYWKRKHKRALGEIVLSAVLLAACAVLDGTGVLPASPLFLVPAYAIPYLPLAWRVLRRAGRNIVRGQVFDENFLMALATVGAFCVGEYAEAVFVMLFYRVGALFEELAVGKSRASVAALAEMRPDVAHVARGGEVLTVDPADVAAGEVILVRAGERVPLDGVIVEGSTLLDTSMLTGESLPREAAAGADIMSGCINLRGLVRVRVSRPSAESTVAHILAMAESAAEHKAKSEQFITRFARYYTPVVVVAAVLLAVVPPLALGAGAGSIWREWIRRALSFLVISCPCALVISVPLAFFGGIGGGARRGILIKGAGYMEALARCDTVVFDKTGTLTEGIFSVQAVAPAGGISADELLPIAAAAEQYSTHPIARAVVSACDCPIPPADAVEELAGCGTTAAVDGHSVAVGNARLLQSLGVAVPCAETGAGTAVYVGVDGRFAGRMTVADTVRAEAAESISALRRLGVRRVVMLTGDGQDTAETVSAEVGTDECHHSLLPDEKVRRLEDILAACPARGTVVFVGDGINDAPAIARADVGVAMGGAGSDVAVSAADVVLMNGRVSALPAALRLSRKTLRIVRQNIIFALTVKAAVLTLGALGLAGLLPAVFADVGVAVLAILNAMRAMR